MWRVQALVGRVLHRCHGSSSIRLPQNHHVEDEVFTGSSVLSTSRHSSDSSSQKEQDGERRKKQRSFQSGCTELPHYTVLDAVGWGAAAALFMQICRRIHSQFSSGTEPGPAPGALAAPSSLNKCGYRILLEILSRQDVLPRGSNSLLCLQVAPERQGQDQSSSGDNQTADSSTSDHQRAGLNHDSSIPDLEESHLSASCPLQNDSSQDNTETRGDTDTEQLTGATQNLRRVGDSSVSVILNIIGLESAKRENYDQALSCFLAAAQQGYNKAQFNVGVCYEKGRGVGKDKEKALDYYSQAAASGHTQAQYRYAKLLLTSRGHQSAKELNTVIDLLEQAAGAGLTEAQLCLASVYCQEPVRNESKSVQFLQMAAESGDDTALLFLGQCHESGFGVRRDLKAAMELYKRAAQAGNKQAESLVTPPKVRDMRSEEAALRSIRSAPLFSVADSLSALATPVPPASLPIMPHSWSTGSLSPTPLHLQPHRAEGGACRWTVGVG